ncbi:MAG TPA: cupin domain-containing protein [Solirubrobacteraceae bacterium]|jgi:transcriptional regulator with XRE-family HTH domain
MSGTGEDIGEVEAGDRSAAVLDDLELSDEDHRVQLGQRIRLLRGRRHLSLTALAKHVGSSSSFLSQLERGTTSASISTLRRISAGLGVTLADLFDEDTDPPMSVLRREDRPSIETAAGTRKFLLTPPPLRHIEVYVGEFDPGTSTGDAYVHGDSQELLLVVAGTVRVEIGEQSHVLSAGDSIEYTSAAPHRTENCGEERAEVLWIVSPPTED